MYRRLRLCSNHGGYEAIADPPAPLDLRAVRAVLEKEGVPVVDARVMLIVSLEAEVTISRAGRLLFKTRDARTAERAFERLRALVGLPEMERGPAEPASSGGPE
ncbi:MAG: hypothetical protein ACLPWO_04160 [Thermoplasmata archaeon]